MDLENYRHPTGKEFAVLSDTVQSLRQLFGAASRLRPQLPYVPQSLDWFPSTHH